jgi:transposase
MQKSLDQMNIRVHHAVSDIDGKTGTEIIKAIVNGERNPANLAKLRDKRCKKTEKEIAEHLTGTWRSEHLFNLGQAFKMMQFLDERLAEYDLKAAEMFAALAAESGNPKPPELPKDKKLTPKERKNPEGKVVLSQYMNFDLTSIDGIDYDAATIIVSELGSKIGSFPDEHHFVSYIGLAPSLSKSAGKKVRQKKRRKNTSRVGMILRMAAVSQQNSQTELGAYYRSVARRIDGKTAVKATARRIAQLVYRGLRYGKEYINRGAQAYESRLRDRTVNTVKKLIKSNNINVLELSTAFVA